MSSEFWYEKHKTPKFPFTIHSFNEKSPNAIVTSHYHDQFEIFFAQHGSVIVNIDGNDILAEANDVFLINKFQYHAYRPVYKKPCVYHAIVFDGSIIDSINLNEFYLDYISPFLHGSRLFPNEIKQGTALHKSLLSSVKLIINEYKKKEMAYEVYISSEIEKLLATLVRYSRVLEDKGKQVLAANRKNMLEKMWKYIDENYQHKIMLKDITDHLNIDRHYFCRLIKSITGRTFTQLLNLYRVNKATQMLKNTDLPVANIIDLCGFSNQSYFNRTYLAGTGHTPTRARALENKWI